jgi:phage/plasmid primase-like uncharacterized protein
MSRAAVISDLVLDELRHAPVGHIAETLSVRLDRHGRGPCPLCKPSERSTAFATRDGRWTCFRCGEHGDAIALVRHVLGVGFFQAATYVASVVGIDISDMGLTGDVEELDRRTRDHGEREVGHDRGAALVMHRLEQGVQVTTDESVPALEIKGWKITLLMGDES